MTHPLGVFARSYPVGPPATVAAAVATDGFDTVQLNLSALGRPTLSEDLTPEQAGTIGAAFTAAGVSIWGLSATFNAIHPDPARRERETAAAVALIRTVRHFGAAVATICTGTRDAADMWRAHPDNTTPAAWTDLRRTLDALLEAAGAGNIRIGIEPEAGNVVIDAKAARRLLDEVGDPRLRIVLDPANLVTPDALDRQRGILDEAFDLLGPETICVQAKDVATDGHTIAGQGGLDYDHIFSRVAGLPGVPVVIQDATPAELPTVVAHLRRWAEPHLRLGLRPVGSGSGDGSGDG